MKYYTVNYKSETFQAIIYPKGYIMRKIENFTHQLGKTNPLLALDNPYL